MKTKILLATATLLAATTISAKAHSTIGLETTLQKHAREIQHARQIGELTWFEKRILLREQRKIARMLGAIKSDGTVTSEEYNMVRTAQRVARDHIEDQSTDRQISRWKRFLYSYRNQNRSQV